MNLNLGHKGLRADLAGKSKLQSMARHSRNRLLQPMSECGGMSLGRLVARPSEASDNLNYQRDPTGRVANGRSAVGISRAAE